MRGTIKGYFDGIINGDIIVQGSFRQNFAKFLDENGLYTVGRLSKINEYMRQARKRKQYKDYENEQKNNME